MLVLSEVYDVALKISCRDNKSLTDVRLGTFVGIDTDAPVVWQAIPAYICGW